MIPDDPLSCSHLSLSTFSPSLNFYLSISLPSVVGVDLMYFWPSALPMIPISASDWEMVSLEE